MRGSRAETRRRWQERLARFETSNLTVAEFCAEEQVSAASFYLWRRRFRDPASAVISNSDSPVPRFLPVLLADSPSTAASFGGPSLDLELPNQIRLRIPRDVEAEFVGRLLVTVAALGPGGLQSTFCPREVR